MILDTVFQFHFFDEQDIFQKSYFYQEVELELKLRLHGLESSHCIKWTLQIWSQKGLGPLGVKDLNLLPRVDGRCSTYRYLREGPEYGAKNQI